MKLPGCSGLGKTPQSPNHGWRSPAGHHCWNQGWGRLPMVAMKARLCRDSRAGAQAEGPCVTALAVRILTHCPGWGTEAARALSEPVVSQPHPEPGPARIRPPSANAGPLGLLQRPFQRSGARASSLALPSPRRWKWTEVRGPAGEGEEGTARGGNQHLAGDLLPAARKAPWEVLEGILLTLLEHLSKNQGPLLLSRAECFQYLADVSVS